MNLRDLQYVVAVAQHRNFTRAARSVHVSQPALSNQIKKVEAELGVRIFERVRNDVLLTKFGEQVVEAAAEINGLVDRISETAQHYRKLDATPFRLGMTPTLAAYLSGYFLDMALHTLGGVVRPGEDILELVPHSEELIVEARINTTDIEKLSVGQSSRIRLSAFDQEEIPEARGRIFDISADAVTDERTGNAFYVAKVRLDERQPDDVQGLEIVPGMSGVNNVALWTGKQASPYVPFVNIAPIVAGTNGISPIFLTTVGVTGGIGIDLKNWVKKMGPDGNPILNNDGNPVLEEKYSVETGTVLTINTKKKKLYNSEGDEELVDVSSSFNPQKVEFMKRDWWRPSTSTRRPTRSASSICLYAATVSSTSRLRTRPTARVSITR